MTDVAIIKEEIERRIREYENTAEECFQELDNEERGNAYLDRAAELKSLLEYIYNL